MQVFQLKWQYELQSQSFVDVLYVSYLFWAFMHIHLLAFIDKGQVFLVFRQIQIEMGCWSYYGFPRKLNGLLTKRVCRSMAFFGLP